MGAAERVQVVTTDVVNENLEGTFDVAVMCAFLQVLSPQEAQMAVQNVGRVTTPGSSAFIMGRGVVDNSRIAPPSGVAFNLYAINTFDGGQAHTVQEYRDWLAAAGFTEDFEWVTLIDGTSIIRATKSAQGPRHLRKITLCLRDSLAKHPEDEA
jgi:hypothetical protein